MELLTSLRRRWILTSILLLLTVVAGVYALIKLPATYQSQSSVIFLASTNMAKPYGDNPYLAFNSALNQTADAVRYETMDVNTAKSLAARGYTASYVVADATDTSGPVLNVTVTSHNKAAAESTLSGVTTQISAELFALQSGVTDANQIQDVVLTFTPKPTVLSSKKSRPLALVVGAGLLLTVAIPLIVDAVLVRRKPTRKAPLGEDQGGLGGWRLPSGSVGTGRASPMVGMAPREAGGRLPQTVPVPRPATATNERQHE